MSNPKKGYVSYLLRLQQIQDENRLTWMMSLQNTATGEQRCFASMDALVDFIWAELWEREIPLEAKAKPSE